VPCGTSAHHSGAAHMDGLAGQSLPAHQTRGWAVGLFPISSLAPVCPHQARKTVSVPWALPGLAAVAAAIFLWLVIAPPARRTLTPFAVYSLVAGVLAATSVRFVGGPEAKMTGGLASP